MDTDPQVSMAAQVRDFDWSLTPLGPRDQWPVALKITSDLILRSKFPKCLCWGPDMTVLYNDAFVPILGQKTGCLGQSFGDVWGEAWDEIGPFARAALAGESTFIKNFPLMVDRGDGMRESWFTFCYSPVADETGRICGFMDTVIETTGEVLTERRIRLLNGELRHRIKNAYAKAIAILRLTIRRAASPEKALDAAINRLRQLDQAQRALLEDIDGNLDIRTLIGEALAGNMADGRLVMQGPTVTLEAEQVFALSLALGELATNAQKYGAWSNSTGRVLIDWREEPGTFHLTWRELGGPPVVEPQRGGFGRELIERGLTHEFRGEAALDFPPEGVVFTLRAALGAPSVRVPQVSSLVAPAP